jgi:hypothetical protein
MADINAQLLHVQFMEDMGTDSAPSRLEVAGRVLAWLEADGKPSRSDDP